MSELSAELNPYAVAVTLAQDPDCCDDKPQELEIRLYDGGGGFYAVLKTDRWACEAHDLRELADRIEQLIVQASRR